MSRAVEKNIFYIESVESGYVVCSTSTQGEVPIKTHLGNSFAPFQKEVATILVDDMNQKAAKIKKTGQLNESLVYCVLSTFAEKTSDNNNHSYDIDIPFIIQWDKIYRLNPGPPLMLYQYNSLLPVINHLDGKWQNFQLNYSQSLEEMKADEVDFVDQPLIDIYEHLFQSFNKWEQFAVYLLFDYFGRTSISLPILWVAGVIDARQWIIINLYFDESKIDELDEEDESYICKFEPVLENLKALLSFYKSPVVLLN